MKVERQGTHDVLAVAEVDKVRNLIFRRAGPWVGRVRICMQRGTFHPLSSTYPIRSPESLVHQGYQTCW